MVKFSSVDISVSLLFGVDDTGVALVAGFVIEEVVVPWMYSSDDAGGSWVVVLMSCRTETLVTFSCVDASVVSLL